MKYRKKPVEIEAIQWTGDNATEIAEFSKTGNRYIEVDEANKFVRIETLEGVMTASLNDFIIKGVAGEFYPCKPDIFEATYEPVGDEMLATAAPTWVDMRMTLVPEDIATIAEWLDNDPRMKKVEFDSDACSLHFEVQYLNTDLTDGIKEASFTICKGTVIVRENGIYRTECKNG